MPGVYAFEISSLIQTGTPLLQTVRIAIVDDHQMFLDGLSEVIRQLDPHYECWGFDSPRKAIEAVEAGQKFDLVISDLVMAEMNGIAFVTAVRARRPLLPIMIVSGIDTAPPVEKVIDAGAFGFVPKSAGSNVLHQAIQAGLTGGTYISDDVWSYVTTETTSRRTNSTQTLPDADVHLGARQTEVLKLLAEGCSNKDIARILNISENTVKSHISSLFRQLGVSRRTACLNKARQLGLID